MVMKRCYTFAKIPASLESHHQIFSVIPTTLVGGLTHCRNVVGVFYSPSWLDNITKGLNISMQTFIMISHSVYLKKKSIPLNLKLVFKKKHNQLYEKICCYIRITLWAFITIYWYTQNVQLEEIWQSVCYTLLIVRIDNQVCSCYLNLNIIHCYLWERYTFLTQLVRQNHQIFELFDYIYIYIL